MRRTRFQKKPLPLFAYRVASAAMLAVLLVQSGCAGEPQTNNIAATSSERIRPSQVNLANLEVFEEQMRRDLPVGTAKKDVEAYLLRWKIGHVFYEPHPAAGPDGNMFHAALDDLGKRLIFDASLSIWIRLDERDEVREIDFRVKYL